MDKKTVGSLAQYKKNLTSGKFRVISLFVPKPVAKKFHALVADSKMSANEVFEIMVKRCHYGEFMDKGTSGATTSQTPKD